MARKVKLCVYSAMKCVVEIVRFDDDDGAYKVLRRFASYSINHKAAKGKAGTLLRRTKDANGVRITNLRGEELYRWRKD